MPENAELISCVYATDKELYMAYMQFLTNGGLFIRSKPGVAPQVTMGQEINLSVTIPNEPKPFLLKAKVVWITPVGVKGNKPPGYGVMFLGEEVSLIKSKMEKCMGSLVSSGQPTDTI